MSSPQEEFAKPGAPGGSFEYDPLEGSLLLFDVISLEPHVPTIHTAPGEKSPAMRCDIHVLDGPKAGEEYMDSLVFPKILQAQLRRQIGMRVLGRLGKGEKQAGKNAPWTLVEATSGDYATAQRWVERRKRGEFASPSVPSDEPPF